MDSKGDWEKAKINLLWVRWARIYAFIKLLVKKMADEENRGFIDKKIHQTRKIESSGLTDKSRRIFLFSKLKNENEQEVWCLGAVLNDFRLE